MFPVRSSQKQSTQWHLLNVLPALLQKLVGDFLILGGGGNFARNLAGILRDFSHTQNKGSKCSGKISEHFWRENSCLEQKIFRANFVLQTRRPNWMSNFVQTISVRVSFPMERLGNRGQVLERRLRRGNGLDIPETYEKNVRPNKRLPLLGEAPEQFKSRYV